MLSNHLFVFGGSTVQPNGTEKIIDSAYRLNLSNIENPWQKIRKLPRARHNHAVFIYSNKIYIIGGTETSGFNVKSCNMVDIYDPTTDTY
jgi:N-acetylneuraminic acid mutarotase